ncbi:MAG: hypothetical protein H7326_09830 [Bdellovibrionaceae bacterium]|nr:hypothetical protein [Pseudobdellovibrionaceae bacterium]
MKTLIKNIFAAALVISAASYAHAQRGGGRPSGYTSPPSYGSSVSFGHQNEIITNFTNGSLFSGKRTKNGSAVTDADLGVKYLRTVNSNIQAGGQVRLQTVGNTPSHTDFTVLGIGVYNFDLDFKQAFFAEGGVGIYPVFNDDPAVRNWENKFGLYIAGGKRFPIWERVSFIPTIALVKKGDVDFAIDIQFLNFSIMF